MEGEFEVADDSIHHRIISDKSDHFHLVLKKGDTDAGAGMTFLHGIYHKSKGIELARLRTVWTKFR